MDCPTCGAHALPGPDAVFGSSDGPLLLTRWRCAANHWWHMATEVGPVCAAGAECGSAGWLANEMALALGLPPISGPGRWPR
jgi:hypothetical protein